jgi:hypothetical protein
LESGALPALCHLITSPPGGGPSDVDLDQSEDGKSLSVTVLSVQLISLLLQVIVITNTLMPVNCIVLHI